MIEIKKSTGVRCICIAGFDCGNKHKVNDCEYSLLKPAKKESKVTIKSTPAQPVFLFQMEG